MLGLATASPNPAQALLLAWKHAVAGTHGLSACFACVSGNGYADYILTYILISTVESNQQPH